MVSVDRNGPRTSLRPNAVARRFAARGFAVLRAIAISLAVAFAWTAGAGGAFAAAKQLDFDSPEQAVSALVEAARGGKTADLVKILGSEGRKLVFSGDRVADKEGREHFTAAFDDANKIEMEGDDKATLMVGKHEWPFPIPIVKQGERWSFDTKAGAQEILVRRIGRNELNTIEVCRAYVDAQREYAAKQSSGGKYVEYAQKIMSTPGKHDGLYWPVAEDEAESPMGPFVAMARAHGYKDKIIQSDRAPYHGYLYRILTRQGKNAQGGAYNYVVRNHMIGGFALVAFPAKYGDSGVMTFIVNQDGIVYQKDLGPKTNALARDIEAFDPDSSWTAVK